MINFSWEFIVKSTAAEKDKCGEWCPYVETPQDLWSGLGKTRPSSLSSMSVVVRTELECDQIAGLQIFSVHLVGKGITSKAYTAVLLVDSEILHGHSGSQRCFTWNGWALFSLSQPFLVNWAIDVYGTALCGIGTVPVIHMDSKVCGVNAADNWFSRAYWRYPINRVLRN